MIGLYHPKDVKRSTPTQQPTIPWSSLLQQRPRQCSTLRLTPQGWGNYQELSCSLSHPHCFITSVAFYCVIAMVAFRGGSIRISSANALASPVEVRRFQWLDCTTLTRSGTHARRRPSAYAYISISILYMYMCMYMHMYLYVSICIYIHIYTYTCVCVWLDCTTLHILIAMVALRGGSIFNSSANALANPGDVRRFQWLDCTTRTRSGTHARRRPSS